MTILELIQILSNVTMLPSNFHHEKAIETFCDYLKNPQPIGKIVVATRATFDYEKDSE